MDQFYFRVLGQEFGPITLESLQSKIVAGELTVTDEFRHGNGMKWTCFADLVNQGFIQHSSPVQAPQPILTWEGGHDDIESSGVDTGIKESNPRPEGSISGSETISADEFRLPSLPTFSVDVRLPLEGNVRKTEDSPEPLVAKQRELPGDSSHPVSVPAEADVEIPVPSAGQKDFTPVQNIVPSIPQWYARMGQVDRGPMDFEKLMDLAARGFILPTDRVREGVGTDWKLARSIPGLFTPEYGFYPQAIPPVPRPSVSLPSIAATNHQTTSSSAASSSPAVHSRPTQPVASPQPVSTENAMPRTYVGSSARSIAFSQPLTENESRIRRNVTEDVDSVDAESPAEVLDVESKHKRRRGHYQEPQLFGDSHLKLVTLIGLIGFLLYFVFSPRTATIGDLSPPFHELNSYYNGLSYKWAEKPTMEMWAATRKQYVHRLDSVILRIKKLHVRHEACNNLVAAGESLIVAAKSDSSDEVAIQLNKAREFLEFASNDLKGVPKPPKSKTGQN